MHKRPKAIRTKLERNIPKWDIAQAIIPQKTELDRKALFRALKRARNESGLLQNEVAQKLNVPQSFVSKYESGDRSLDLIELLQVCRALGITFEKFLLLFELEQAITTLK